MTSLENRKRRKHEWYLKNKDRIESKRKASLTEEKKTMIKIKYALSRRCNPVAGMLSRAKQRAIRDGLEYDISASDVHIPDLCPVLNTVFEYGTPYAASLDRKDSSKGYVKGNVQVISLLANRMKQNATTEELKNFAKWVICNE